jgi:hypothetical protein
VPHTLPFAQRRFDPVKVFISYSHEDVDSAKRLYNDLKAIPNIEPWFDNESLLPGMQWRPAIRKAIREARFFIVLLSSHCATRQGYFNSEMNEALEILQEFPQDQTFIVPARLENCRIPHDKLSELQYVDLFPNWQVGFNKVRAVIEREQAKLIEKADAASALDQYRCAIVDLEGGLPNLMQVAQRLNQIQTFFHFTNPKLTLTKNCVIDIRGHLNFSVYDVPASFFKEREYLNTDLVACLTRYPVAFIDKHEIMYNYFSGPNKYDNRFMFISTHMLHDFSRQAGCTFEKGIAYIIASQLVVRFTDVGYHHDTRDCLMDFCELRTDIVRGMRAKRLCDRCSPRIINKQFKDAIISIITSDIRV